MNGRAYDYNLGRFLSVDPFIQEPGNSQSMNPYSYIMNNPLAGMDPSGYRARKEGCAQRVCGSIYESNGRGRGHNIQVPENLAAIGLFRVAVILDEVSDYINPIKGIAKKGIKETVKAGIKEAKDFFGKKNVATNNAADPNMQKAASTDKIGGSSDQKMVDNLVQQRKDSKASGDATFAQGRDGDGNLTSVRESKVDGSSHAETQVMKDLEGTNGPHTIAVDQVPCSNCASQMSDAGVSKVIVPSKASNPVGSPKTAARGAAERGTEVKPREIKLEDKINK